VLLGKYSWCAHAEKRPEVASKRAAVRSLFVMRFGGGKYR
jgi:hypothetical protein